MTWRVGTAAVVLLSACGGTSTSSITGVEYSLAQAADSIPLRYRTETRVGDVYMTLASVSSDSRCPRGVTCVWAGDAVASVVVDPGCIKAGCRAPSAVLALHATLQPQAGDALGYRVQLLSLQPEPARDVVVDSSRYVAWVRVTR